MGFFVHIFNGVAQSKVHFNQKYILKTVFNFFKTLFVMGTTSLIIGTIVLLTPEKILISIGTDKLFLEQIVFYLFAFASFDFGLQNEFT
jgi:ABC-type transporter Mla maintaining outer membrane lipid asymmetry permease subunit MlaE